MVKSFSKTPENFTCENCDTYIVGNGYTNHCYKCLFSKHVDVNPGDRMESCNGIMQPTEISSKNGEYVLIHKCIKCGIRRKNKTSKSDLDSLIELSKNIPYL